MVLEIERRVVIGEIEADIVSDKAGGFFDLELPPLMM